MPVVGLMGGFFESLGWTGIASMVIGGVVWVFLHGYISGVIVNKIKAGEAPTEQEYMTAELYTTAGLIAPPLIFGVLRTTRYTYESDVLDFFGNFMGGAFFYEVLNLIEMVGAAIGIWTAA